MPRSVQYAVVTSCCLQLGLPRTTPKYSNSSLLLSLGPGGSCGMLPLGGGVVFVSSLLDGQKRFQSVDGFVL
jgi:hypothetical protein